MSSPLRHEAARGDPTDPANTSNVSSGFIVSGGINLTSDQANSGGGVFVLDQFAREDAHKRETLHD